MAEMLGDVPCSWWISALLWSAIQGFRGAVEHDIVGTYRTRAYPKAGSVPPTPQQTTFAERLLVVYGHDFAYRAICTFGGCLALFVVWFGAKPADGAEWAAFVGLLAIAIVGVGGQLHYVLLRGGGLLKGE